MEIKLLKHLFINFSLLLTISCGLMGKDASEECNEGLKEYTLGYKEYLKAKGRIFDFLRETDYLNAIDHYQKSCDLDCELGCNNLASMYFNGEGVKKNIFIAKDYYQKACDLGSGMGCFNLGAMYEYGEGVKKDFSKALSFYQKSCKMTNGRGCNNLGSMYEYGKGVKIDKEKALEYYGKACDWENDLGCKNYARLKK